MYLFYIFISGDGESFPLLFVLHEGANGLDEKVDFVESVAQHGAGIDPEFLGELLGILAAHQQGSAGECFEEGHGQSFVYGGVDKNFWLL